MCTGFLCNDGQCVSQGDAVECNGVAACRDNTDEEGCCEFSTTMSMENCNLDLGLANVFSKDVIVEDLGSSLNLYAAYVSLYNYNA